MVEDSADVPCRLDGSHVRDAFGHAISRTVHGSNDEVWYLGTKYAVDYNHPFAGSRRTLEDRRNQTPGAVNVRHVGDGAFFASGRSGSSLTVQTGDLIFILSASFQRSTERSNLGLAAPREAKPRLTRLANVVLCEAT